MLELLDARDLGLIVAIVALGWLGVYLLLPHRHGGVKPIRLYAIGALLAALAVLMLTYFWVPPGPLLPRLFFYSFGVLAVGGGILMVTARNPVHSALWFAVVVLSSSGLFLLAGAQFLAAGTVIVYAGAIIVTFLFVIMLAQSHGQAAYDRMARRPLAASLSTFLLFGTLLASILSVRAGESYSGNLAIVDRRLPSAETVILNKQAPPSSPLSRVVRTALPETTELPNRTEQGQTPPHVAGLGGTLFTDHLISIEVVALLLFVALIGAVAIATPKAPVRPSWTTAGAEPGPSVTPPTDENRSST